MIALIHLRVAFFNLGQIPRLIFRYYKKWTFLKCHLLLRLFYFTKSPYKISEGIYGETPLKTLDKIAKEARILSKDVVYELGCGRGEALFWLTLFTGCRGVGIDTVPEFIAKAKKIKTKLNLSRLEFRCEDMLETDLRGSTVIYLYGTTLSDEMIEKLTTKFAALPIGTKVITVSYPLESPAYSVQNTFSARFAWGKAEIFLNVRK